MQTEKQRELKQMYNDLVEIFDEEYEKRRLITPQNTAEKMTAKGYRKQEWIPVTEALPEEGCASVVAVIYRDNPLQDWECVVTAAYFVPINGKIDGMWVLLDDEKIESKEIHITHWMPLPEAPKGGAE
jgi:hypothetical protein